MFFAFRYLRSPRVYLRALRIKLRSLWIKRAHPRLKLSQAWVKDLALSGLALGGALGVAWTMIDLGEQAIAVVLLIATFVALALHIKWKPGIPAHPTLTKRLKIACCCAALVVTSTFAAIAHKKATTTSWSTLIERDMVATSGPPIPVPTPAQTAPPPQITPPTFIILTQATATPTPSASPSPPHRQRTVTQRKKKPCKWNDTILGKCPELSEN